MHAPSFICQGDVRAAAILTTSYVASIAIPQAISDSVENTLGDFNVLRVDLDFTKGNLTSAQLKIETSPDGVNWYQTCSESISAGVVTSSVEEWTWSANFSGTIYRTIAARYARVSVKGIGTVTGSSMRLIASYGNKQIANHA